MRLLLLFISIPLIEIALFIQIGGWIGLWPTLFIVILTAFLGSWLVKTQGLAVLEKVRRSFSDLDDPSQPLAEGAMIIFSGALLLTPGFFTDSIGFLLLIPSVRHSLFQYLRKRISVRLQTKSSFSVRQKVNDEDIIETEYEDVTNPKKPTHVPSEWTKH